MTTAQLPFNAAQLRALAAACDAAFQDDSAALDHILAAASDATREQREQGEFAPSPPGGRELTPEHPQSNG